MKKKIGLRIILITEIVIFAFFCFAKVFTNLQTIPVLNIIYIIGEWYFNLMKGMAQGLSIDKLTEAMFKNNMLNVAALITLVIFNIFFVGIYYLIFGVLTIVVNKQMDKKIRQVVKPYILSTNEYDKFNYHHYLNRFPIRRIVSLIIPITFILFFIFARFDEIVCFEANAKLSGNLRVYTNNIMPCLNRLFEPASFKEFFLNMMTTSDGHGYIDLMNNILGNVTWVEYVFIFFSSLIILVAWYGFFTLIHLLYKKPYAKHCSRKGREYYVRKMELIEYKLHNKYKDETNIKSDEFMHIVEKEQQDAAKEIARFRKDLDTDESLETRNSEEMKKDYYDEISKGVVDLGVSNETVDLDKPIIEREVKYITEEDIDIILDEEPVIEMIENEKEESSLDFGKDEIFFEKYEPDDIELQTLEAYGNEFILDQKEKKTETISLIEEDEKELKPESSEDIPSLIEDDEPSKKETPVEEEKVETETTNEVKEETLVDTPSVAEPLEKSIEKVEEKPTEEVTENVEETLEETPTEENNEVTEIVERPTEKTEKTEEVKDTSEEIVETEATEEAKEETPIESQEVVEETKEVEEKVEEPTENKEENKDNDIIEVEPKDIVKETKVEDNKLKSLGGFAKYIGRKNKPGYGAKKVPSFKEIQEEKQNEKENKK